VGVWTPVYKGVMTLRLARFAAWTFVSLTVWYFAAIAGINAQTPVPVAVQQGMTINPDAELDTSLFVDDRNVVPITALVPVSSDDVYPAVWDQMIAMGYIGDPTDGTDDVIYAPRGVAGALNRIHDGLNR